MNEGRAVDPHVSDLGIAFSPPLRSAYMSPQPSLSAPVTQLPLAVTQVPPAATQLPPAVTQIPLAPQANDSAAAPFTVAKAGLQIPEAPAARTPILPPDPSDRSQMVPTADPSCATRFQICSAYDCHFIEKHAKFAKPTMVGTYTDIMSM